MRRYIVLLALVVCPAAHAAALPTGIPAPGFGLDQAAGAPTAFVNNTHIAATDTNNPLGTATRPRRTMPTTLPAGTVVEVRGGPYAAGVNTWTAQGTRTAPVFVVGVGNPVFTGNGSGDRLRYAGSYFVIEGLTFRGVQHEITGTAVAIRRSEITATNNHAVIVKGPGTVLYRDTIHHNGNADALVENDTHGVYVTPGTYYTWVLENQIYRNGGDGVQVGSDLTGDPYVRYAFVAGNTIHEDRENGVDVKRAQDVVVSQNTIYGYVVRDSSGGESVVVHGQPQRVWVVDNVVFGSHQGIVCTGANGYYVLGNLILGIRHPAGAPYDPVSLWGASGVLTYNTTGSVHANNTIWASDAGISIPNGGRTDVVDNIAGGLTGASSGVRVASAVLRLGSVVGNNLGTDPGFVAPASGDFHLKATAAAAIDRGVGHVAYETYRATYGVGLDRDVYGGARRTGTTVDIGAAELVK